MMEGLSAFLEMGGYARFVWPSFGVVFLVLTVLLITSLRRWKREQEILEALQANRETAPIRGTEGTDAS